MVVERTKTSATVLWFSQIIENRSWYLIAQFVL